MFLPLALLVIQTRWLGITGRRKVCREILIEKLKPFIQMPANIKECQMEADNIPEEGLDEEAVKPVVEPDESLALEEYIQCVEVVPLSTGSEEATIHKEKDSN